MNPRTPAAAAKRVEIAVKATNLTLAPVVRRTRVPYDAYVHRGGGGGTGAYGDSSGGAGRRTPPPRRKAQPVRHPCTIATAKATWAKSHQDLPRKQVSESVKAKLMVSVLYCTVLYCTARPGFAVHVDTATCANPCPSAAPAIAPQRGGVTAHTRRGLK